MSINMNIMSSMNGPRVVRTTNVSNTNAQAPRRNVLGGMGIIDRIRYTPAGCSSCGGR